MTLPRARDLFLFNSHHPKLTDHVRTEFYKSLHTAPRWTFFSPHHQNLKNHVGAELYKYPHSAPRAEAICCFRTPSKFGGSRQSKVSQISSHCPARGIFFFSTQAKFGSSRPSRVLQISSHCPARGIICFTKKKLGGHIRAEFYKYPHLASAKIFFLCIWEEWSVCVCVYACGCHWECAEKRERERERENIICIYIYICLYKFTRVYIYMHIACVVWNWSRVRVCDSFISYLRVRDSFMLCACTICACDFDRKKPPPPGGFPIYYVPSSRTVSKRTPLEAPGTNSSRGVLLLTVIDERT